MEPKVQRYAVIKNNAIINVILWDGESQFEYTEGVDDIILLSDAIKQGIQPFESWSGE